MNEPTTKKSPAGKVVLAAVLVGVGLVVFSGFRQMREAADYSAYAALNAEIQSNLVFLSYTHRPFPPSLADLPLRYPDGGDSALLRRFEYVSFGTNCTLRFRLPLAKEDTVRSF